jgi:hypothetical protein
LPLLGSWTTDCCGIGNAAGFSLRFSQKPISGNLEWKPDDKRSADIPVTPVGKYKSPLSGFSGNSTLDKRGNNKIWHGQKITFEYNGTKDTGYVAGWDNETIQVQGSGLTDEIQRFPSAVNPGRIIDGEDWADLTDTEKKQQIKDEIKFRVDKIVESKQHLNAYADWLSDEWYERFNDEESAHTAISNMVSFTDITGFGVGGNVSGLIGVADPEYRFTLGAKTDASGNFIRFKKRVAYHEMFHAAFRQHNLKTSNDLTSAFNVAKEEEYPGEFPLTAYNFDGSKNDDLFSELKSKTSEDIPTHDDIGDILYSNDRQGVLGEENIDITPPVGSQKQITTSDIDESQWQTDKGVNDLFDPEPSEIEIGDLLRVVDFKDGGKEHELVFKGLPNDPKSNDDGIQWTFQRQNGEEFFLEVDGNGNFVYDGDIEVTGFYSPEKEDNWWAVDDTDWEPSISEESPLLRLAEAANRVLRRQHSIYTDDWLDGKEHSYLSYRVGLKNGYASSNAAELTSALVEIMQSSNDTAWEAKKVYKAHPELVKSFLEVMEPSPQVKSELREFDELSEYL